MLFNTISSEKLIERPLFARNHRFQHTLTHTRNHCNTFIYFCFSFFSVSFIKSVKFIMHFYNARRTFDWQFNEFNEPQIIGLSMASIIELFRSIANVISFFTICIFISRIAVFNMKLLQFKDLPINCKCYPCLIL